MSEFIMMVGIAFFFLAPFVVADQMAERRDTTRLGVFILVFFFSWFVPVGLLFIKIPTREHKPFSNVTLTTTKDV